MQESDGDMDKQVSSIATSKAPSERYRKEYAGHQTYDSAPSRRPVPQKEKTLDKRPKERGFRSYGGSGEVMRNAGKPVKQSLNHLLNFTYEERSSIADPAAWRRRAGYCSGRLRFRKEQFLQANCQFVIREGGDYTALTADADCIVDWSVIEQLRIFDSDVPCCPICLYPPTVARITKCGHVYCWSCMLHYLSLADKTCRCPICFEEVCEGDLKSVKFSSLHKFKVGEQLTMTLMRRERGSTYIQPKSVWLANGCKDGSATLHFVDDQSNVKHQFFKFVLARPTDVLEIVHTEQLALEKQLFECGGEKTLEGTYVTAALTLLEDKKLHVSCARRESLSAVKDNKAMESACTLEDDWCTSKPSAAATAEGGAYQNPAACREEDAGFGSTPAGLDTVRIDSTAATSSCSAVHDALDMPEKRKANVKTDVYYFYQSADGQHIYLHSLNARCLAKEYSSLEKAPEVLVATVVEMECMTMTEELRKRLRYLSHIPLSCQFMVVELALLPPLVSPNTLRMFDDDIKRRQRARNKKEHMENELSKRAELEQDRMMGRFPELCVPITSESHFPEVLRSSSEVETTTASSVTACGTPETAGKYRTFAQTLRAVVDKASASGSKGSAAVCVEDEVGSEDVDAAAAPRYQTAFGDALERAFNNLTLTSVGHDQVAEKGTGKKKKKQKLLFSTTIARAKS